VTLESAQPERMLISRGTVEIPHEDESREDVRGDHLWPRNHRDTGGVARQQTGIEGELLSHQAEQHAEQQPRRGSQGGDRPGHGNAKDRKHSEVHDGIGRDESERRGTDRLAGERAREGGRCVKGPARQGVDREEPERYDQPGEDSADHAVGDQRVQ